MKREKAIKLIDTHTVCFYNEIDSPTLQALHMAIEALKSLPSAEAVPQSEQYKKGFEDAKRAFLVEYARESENMRKRIAQLEVMLNAQKAISADVEPKWNCTANFVAEQLDRLRKMTDEERWDFLIKFFSPSADAVQGEWVDLYECSVCGKQAFDFIEGFVEGIEYLPNFCPSCGADMRGGGERREP